MRRPSGVSPGLGCSTSSGSKSWGTGLREERKGRGDCAVDAGCGFGLRVGFVWAAFFFLRKRNVLERLWLGLGYPPAEGEQRDLNAEGPAECAGPASVSI